MNVRVRRRDWLFWILVLIAAGTILSGVVQMFTPRFILGIVGGPVSDDTAYFFAIIGMFMTLFGALMIQALLDAADHPIIVFWAAMQKLGAAGAVGLGVHNTIFAPLALGVAGFDLLSGLLMLGYWNRIRLERSDRD